DGEQDEIALRDRQRPRGHLRLFAELRNSLSQLERPRIAAVLDKPGDAIAARWMGVRDSRTNSDLAVDGALPRNGDESIRCRMDGDLVRRNPAGDVFGLIR